MLLKFLDGFVGHRRRCFALVSFFFLVPNVFFFNFSFLVSFYFLYIDSFQAARPPRPGVHAQHRLLQGNPPGSGSAPFFLNVLMFNSLTLTFLGFFWVHFVRFFLLTLILLFFFSLLSLLSFLGFFLGSFCSFFLLTLILLFFLF